MGKQRNRLSCEMKEDFNLKPEMEAATVDIVRVYSWHMEQWWQKSKGGKAHERAMGILHGSEIVDVCTQKRRAGPGAVA